MLTNAQRSHIAAVTRTLQIILAALASGVIMFAAVALLVATQNAAPQKGNTDWLPLTYIAAVVAFVSLVIAWVLPNIIANSQRQSLATAGALRTGGNALAQPPGEDLGEIGVLANMQQTRAIVGAAILEGAALLNVIAYMIGGRPLSLVIAGLLVACMLSRFPTIGKMGNWIENDLTTVGQLRQLESPHG